MRGTARPKVVRRMPLPDRLPPFAALRMFEVASRHPNFSAAASELHVTPGAISRQITELEQRLGVALFVREARRTRLTAVGAQLAERLRAAFALLRDALRAAAFDEQRALVVTVLPSFASRWLLPRLPAFAARHPEVELDLRPSRELVDLERDGVDLAIRYGRGRWPGTETCRLLDEQLFPVCAPELARRLRPRALADLLAAPLIHDQDFPWSRLFDHHGIATPRRLPGIRVDDSGLALQAAERGQGVLLARSVLVADALAAGRLVRLLRIAVASDYAYHVAWPRSHPLSPAAEAFRRWLLEVAAPPKARKRAPGARRAGARA
jgi:LysR family glycine cleavage system transcriptional activator